MMYKFKDFFDTNHIKVHFIKKGDIFCQSNGEELYINNSFSTDDEIWIGIYEDNQKKVLSLLHEMTHCVCKIPNCFHDKFELEKFIWDETFKLAKKFEIDFTQDIKNWANEQLITYKKCII